MSNDPYSYLDAHDDMIEKQHKQWEQQNRHWEKAFDSSLNQPDPLAAVENSILNPAPSSLPTKTPPGLGPAPIVRDPAVINTPWKPAGVRLPDPPGGGYVPPNEKIFEYQPPKYRSNTKIFKSGGKGSGVKVYCPKTKKTQPCADCKGCDSYSKDVSVVHSNCKKKKAEAKRLAAKKK